MNTKLLAAAALIAVLAGCATSAPPLSSIVLINADHLAKMIEVKPLQTQTTETGTLRVWFDVKNLTKTRMMVEGRASFVGAGGQPVESPTAWQRLFIESESSGAVQFLSMVTTARQIKIELREGR